MNTPPEHPADPVDDPADLNSCEICGATFVPLLWLDNDDDPRVPRTVCLDSKACGIRSTADQDPHWWPRLADRINTWWLERQPTWPALREMATIPPRHARIGILTAAAGVLALVVLILWWLIAALVALVTGIGDAITTSARTAGHTATDHVTTAGLTRTITDPVHAYLTAHATGLPLTAHTLWITWLATTGGLFILAAFGSRGARIGWPLTGALTTAMVYAGTPTPGRLVAVGLTVTAWAVLSVVAFNRLAGGNRPPVLRIHLPARRATQPARTATKV